MDNQSFKRLVNVSIVNIFIEVFGDSRELRYQTKSVHDKWLSIFDSKELVLVDDAEAVALNELLSKLLRALC